jgi:Magnesium chelatase, subunit ChlI C-terminal
LRVARTIADLEGAEAVTVHHVREALLFRSLDASGLDTAAPPAAYKRPGTGRSGLGVH